MTKKKTIFQRLFHGDGAEKARPADPEIVRWAESLDGTYAVFEQGNLPEWVKDALPNKIWICYAGHVYDKVDGKEQAIPCVKLTTQPPITIRYENRGMIRPANDAEMVLAKLIGNLPEFEEDGRRRMTHEI